MKRNLKGWTALGMMVTLAACGGGKTSEKAETKSLPTGCAEADLSIAAAPAGESREAEFKAIPKGALLRAEKVVYAMVDKGKKGSASFRMEETFRYGANGEATSEVELKCQSGLNSEDAFGEVEGTALVGLKQEDSVARPDLFIRQYKLKNEGDRVSMSASSKPRYIGDPGEELEKNGWVRRKLYKIDRTHYELRLEHSLEMDGQSFSQWMSIRYEALLGKSAEQDLEIPHAAGN